MQLDLVFVIVATLCGFGQYLDCRTTDAGLAAKLVEANSLAAKLQAKIGAGGFFVLKCMAIPGIACLIAGTCGFPLGIAFAAILAVTGWVAGLKNWALLKKHNVKVW